MKNVERSEVVRCGAILRAAREKLGLRAEDIATDLRLSTHQIEALEKDDWSELPGTTYARGYLKAYARLLGIDSNELMNMSEDQPDSEDTETKVTAKHTGVAESYAPPNKPKDNERTTGRGFVGFYLLALLIVGLGAGGWYGWSWYESGNDLGPVAQHKPLLLLESSSQSNDQLDSVTQPESITNPTLDERHIVFEFAADSWVDVRDARSQRLLYRKFGPGRAIEIEGEPPFRIFLGYADAVTVKYQGNSLDLSKFQTRMFARFQLPIAE